VAGDNFVSAHQPYYNEAGYEKQLGSHEGRHKSRQYSESTLLLVLKHMETSVRHPIPPFEVFTRAHFAARGHEVLARCRRMLSDTAPQVASAKSDVLSGDDSRSESSSTIARGRKVARRSQADVASEASGELEDVEASTGLGGLTRSEEAKGWTDRSVPERASKGFVRSLEKLLPRLEQTFRDVLFSKVWV
jgi:hypothetical protein